MPFRQAYLDSMDAALNRLQKEIDQIAVVTASFHHLSAAGVEEMPACFMPTETLPLAFNAHPEPERHYQQACA